MAGDKHTYGFSKQDARDLLQTIGGGDVEFPEIRPRGRGGGGGGSRLVVFELTADLTSRSAAAKFYEVSDDHFLDPGNYIEDATLVSPLGIGVGILVTGDLGHAVAQDGRYVFIQADCEQEPVE